MSYTASINLDIEDAIKISMILDHIKNNISDYEYDSMFNEINNDIEEVNGLLIRVCNSLEEELGI